jgi:uncharacterized protein (DUF1778 family)
MLMGVAAINLRASPEQRDLIDQVFFRLNAEQFAQFNALLDAPVNTNAGLKRLTAVKPPWVSA